MDFENKNHEDITQEKCREGNEHGQVAGRAARGISIASDGQRETSKSFRRCSPWSSLPTALEEPSGIAHSDPGALQNMSENDYPVTSLQLRLEEKGGDLGDESLVWPKMFQRWDSGRVLPSSPEGESGATDPETAFGSNNGESLQPDFSVAFNHEQKQSDFFMLAMGGGTLPVDVSSEPFMENVSKSRPFERMSSIVGLGDASCRPSRSLRDFSAYMEMGQEKSSEFFNLNTIIKEVCKFVESIFEEQLVVIYELNPIPMLYGCSSLLRDALFSLFQYIVHIDEYFERKEPLIIKISTQPFSHIIYCSIDVCNSALCMLQNNAQKENLVEEEWQLCPNELLASAREIIVSKCRGKLDLIRQQSQATFSMSLLPAVHGSFSC